MKIDKLNETHVRTPRSEARLVTLDEASLKTVVGGRGLIDSSICEIHFYYPADGAN